VLSEQVHLQNDIYYLKDYSALYLNGGDSIYEYEYCEGQKRIVFRSIKRLIHQVAGTALDEPLYDLESQYGYGGPLTNDYSHDFLLRAFDAYKKKCIEEKIVSEFIRFHPFNQLGDFDFLYDFHSKEREVVIVDLLSDVEERWKRYSKTTRNILRKTSCKLIRSANVISIQQFQALYNKTMDKNQAGDFYYFGDDYFEHLSAIAGVDLLAVSLADEIVSCGYFMHSGDLAHYHLSANNADYIKENGNYELLDFAFDHAKAKGCKYMMLGGGRTSAIDDPLFQFKAKFSPVSLPFYISGVDFMPEKKQQLNKMWDAKHPERNLRLFQKYRAE